MTIQTNRISGAAIAFLLIVALMAAAGAGSAARAQGRPAVEVADTVPFDEPYFEDGYAIVERDGKWGVINERHEVVVPFEWDGCYGFSEGLAAVQRDGLWGYVDTTGTVVIAPAFFMADSFYGGLAAVQPEARGKYGFIDKSGAMAIPPRWDWAGGFSGLLAPVMSGEFGFIDRSGRVVIPLQYDSAAGFVDGRAEVEKDGRVFYINFRGEEVAPDDATSILGRDVVGSPFERTTKEREPILH